MTMAVLFDCHLLRNKVVESWNTHKVSHNLQMQIEAQFMEDDVHP